MGEEEREEEELISTLVDEDLPVPETREDSLVTALPLDL